MEIARQYEKKENNKMNKTTYIKKPPDVYIKPDLPNFRPLPYHIACWRN